MTIAEARTHARRRTGFKVSERLGEAANAAIERGTCAQVVGIRSVELDRLAEVPLSIAALPTHHVVKDAAAAIWQRLWHARHALWSVMLPRCRS